MAGDAHEKTRRARRWRGVRAGLISACLLASALLLLPGGERIGNRRVWKTELNQSQFAEWSRALGGFGVELSPREFEELLWSGVQRYLALQRPIVSALMPITTQLGTHQSWRMFSNPQTHPARLQIDVDRGQGYEPVYVSRSEEYAWRKRQFDHNRLRKMIGRLVRKGRRKTYVTFGRWVTEDFAKQYPDTQRVRVRLFRWKTPAPGYDGAYDADGKYEALITFKPKRGKE